MMNSQTLLDLASILLGLVVVGQFTWAMRFHFTTEKMPPAAKMISVISIAMIALFIYLLMTRVQPAGAHVAGLLMMIGASLLFVSAIRASKKARLWYVFEGRSPNTLVTDGPYRYLRHPFYVSYLVLWSGWALTTFSLVSILPVMIIALVYMRAAKGEEATIAASPLGHDYAAYKRRAGFFWPKFGSSS
jgi:protein-S-isoprenylcysteine O-methyltransferase Ste14